MMAARRHQHQAAFTMNKKSRVLSNYKALNGIDAVLGGANKTKFECCTIAERTPTVEEFKF